LGRGGTKFEGFAKGFDIFFFKFFEDGVREVFGEELDVSEYTRHVGWMVWMEMGWFRRDRRR
jgi:hypothetical protein